MTLNLRTAPPWLATVLLAADDTEESVMGTDLHQVAIFEAYGQLEQYAREIGAEGVPAWYVSSQVTVIVRLPRKSAPWRPKPDLFVVPGVPAHSRSSYDTRTEGPMPAFILEVASESTWHNDVEEKTTLYNLTGVREYLVFDPTQEHLKRPMRGWHRVADKWSEWEPLRRADGTAVWESAVLGLAVRPEGFLVRFDHPQRGPLPLRRELAALAARLAEREQELQEAQRQLAEVQAELRRLQEKER